MALTDTRIAVVSSALSADPREAPALARQLGFAGVLFDAFTATLNIPDLSGTGRREFRKMLSDHAQELVGLRVDVGPRGFGPGADVDRLLAGLDRVMEAAAGVATPLVCVEIGPLPEPVREEKLSPAITADQAGLLILPTAVERKPQAPARPAPPPDPAFGAQVDAALLDLGWRADRYNVVVALRSELASFAALDGALGRAGCPWFGVDLDPVSVLRDEWGLGEVFSRLGSAMRHVLARDAIKGADRRTKPAPIGKGSTNWPELLAHLDDAAYKGWITVDPTEVSDRLAGAQSGLDLLKRAIGKPRLG